MPTRYTPIVICTHLGKLRFQRNGLSTWTIRSISRRNYRIPLTHLFTNNCSPVRSHILSPLLPTIISSLQRAIMRRSLPQKFGRHLADLLAAHFLRKYGHPSSRSLLLRAPLVSQQTQRSFFTRKMIYPVRRFRSLCRLLSRITEAP